MSEKLNVVIIDYDMGNVRSIENAVRHVGNFNIEVSSCPETISNADCIILPGVGAYPDAMKKLNERDLVSTLNNEVLGNKKPVLGICLGMQLLFDYSEEIMKTSGLGWIPGGVKYMKPGKEYRVPHVGWNSLKVKEGSDVFSHLGDDKDFYFVHSLCAECPSEFIEATCEYGIEVTAAVRKENIFGMQFHPEKSQTNGLSTIRKFLEYSMQEAKKRETEFNA